MFGRLVFAAILTGSLAAPVAVLLDGDLLRHSRDVPLLSSEISDRPSDINAARAGGYLNKARTLLSEGVEIDRACRLLQRAAALGSQPAARLSTRHCE